MWMVMDWWCRTITFLCYFVLITSCLFEIMSVNFVASNSLDYVLFEFWWSMCNFFFLLYEMTILCTNLFVTINVLRVGTYVLGVYENFIPLIIWMLKHDFYKFLISAMWRLLDLWVWGICWLDRWSVMS